MNSWKKIKRLTPAEFGMLISAILLLPLMDLLLRAFGYFRLLRILEKLTPIHEDQNKIPVTSETLPKAIARITAIAANRGLYHATCLRKSLVVLWFLRRQGIEGVIRFGVRLTNGILEAHAWVEWQGIIINDEADVRERYAPLASGFPQTQAGL